MVEKYCQSCGMPMGDTNEMYGNKKDGSKSNDYCKYCYDKGDFTANITMDEMIEFCVPHMASTESGMKEEDARNMMKMFFPTLKRWNKV